ncbi:hypothetical protein [Pediococcus pentosaceus]|uniref:hypothetical protein n=1 Tax=Pediococcus pentosaceus TaxID=1255 RepID=UPI00359316E3
MGKISYNIGLDIGTSSIGFAATDNLNKPIRAKVKPSLEYDYLKRVKLQLIDVDLEQHVGDYQEESGV